MVMAAILCRLPKDLSGEGYEPEALASLKDKEIVALIAYLQRLGTDIKLEQQTAENE